MSDPPADGRYVDSALSTHDTDLLEERREPIRLRDVVFWLIFISYTLGGLFVLAQGIAAVVAHHSPAWHDSLHIDGLGSGYSARVALRIADASHNVPSTLSTVLSYAFSFFNIAIALFVLFLRPRDRTARLLAIGLVGIAGVFNLTAQSAYETLPLLTFESIAQSGAHIVAGLAYGAALVLFPDGRLVPRWKARYLALVYLPIVVGIGFLALRVQGTARPGALLVYFGLVVPAIGVIAQAYRFRRAQTPTDHAQARLLFWALAPAFVIGAWFLGTHGIETGSLQYAGRHLPQQPTFILRIFQPVFLLVPLALFAGLVRFRLWDIDRVVNRTLVYGLATAVPLAGYFGIVVVLQRVLRPFTAGEPIAVSLSTLAAAAAFFPLRRRVQDFVDRRFYRHRYDAQQTIEAFSTRLRDQLDLEALAYELRGVVVRTMQPSEVTLLVKDPDDGRLQWQWTYRGRS